ncbi:MAG: hypothetical protein ACYSUB_01945 [Planctomycetota bacterium]|jgi:hypothetical protein
MRHTFQTGQTVWWLNHYYWRVQEAVIVKYGRKDSVGVYWEIMPVGSERVLVYDFELYINKEDAYKDSIAELTKVMDAASARLAEATIKRQKLIDEAKKWIESS